MFWGIIFILVLLIPLAAVILDSELGRALAARLEGRSRPDDSPLIRRVAALESEVERLNREVQRLEEESEFLHRLLQGKSAEGRALSSGEPGD